MIYSAGIDALSFTMLAGSDESQTVNDLFDRYIEQDKAAGNDVQEKGRHGFDGISSKHLFRGNNGKHNFYEVGGRASDEIANTLRDARLAVKVTRADFAVTFQNPAPSAEYANDLRLYVKGKLSTDCPQVPSKLALWESQDNGNTLYIQSGDKTVMHRTYNKAVQSPGEYPPDAWRHELQLRQVRARRAFTEFSESRGSDFLSRAYIAGFLMNYGVYEDWMNDVEPARYPGKKVRSDTERRLQWLENVSVPVIEKLLAANVSQSAIVCILQRAGLDIDERPNKFS
jgi:DNA relaxase NicK